MLLWITKYLWSSYCYQPSAHASLWHAGMSLWATSAAKGQFHEPVGFPWCQGPPRNLLRYQGSRNVGWRIAPGLPFSANLAAARSSAHKLQAFPTYPTWTRIQSKARDVQRFRNDSPRLDWLDWLNVTSGFGLSGSLCCEPRVMCRDCPLASGLRIKPQHISHELSRKAEHRERPSCFWKSTTAKNIKIIK